MKSLYEITGRIEDINTVLVQRGEFEALAQAARQPLTSAQIDEIADQHRSQLNGQPYFAWYDYARAIERAHGIGGHL